MAVAEIKYLDYEGLSLYNDLLQQNIDQKYSGLTSDVKTALNTADAALEAVSEDVTREDVDGIFES